MFALHITEPVNKERDAFQRIEYDEIQLSLFTEFGRAAIKVFHGLVVAIPSHVCRADVVKKLELLPEHFPQVTALIKRTTKSIPYYSLLVHFTHESEWHRIRKRYHGASIDSTSTFYLLSLTSLTLGSTPITKPLEGFTCQPYCPVCLERYDVGAPDIWFRHYGWSRADSELMCKTCQIINQYNTNPTHYVCEVCGTNDDIYVCLICAKVACGRYAGAHAKRHSEEPLNHSIAMDLNSGRIWHYLEDRFVERRVHTPVEETHLTLDSVKETVGGKIAPDIWETQGSTLQALKVALREAIQRNDNDDIIWLEGLTAEWLYWMQTFTDELLKSKSLYEFQIGECRAIHQAQVSEIEEQLDKLTLTQDTLTQQKQQAKKSITKQRKKLATVKARISSLKEDGALLESQIQPCVKEDLSKYEQELLKVQSWNDELRKKIDFDLAQLCSER